MSICRLRKTGEDNQDAKLLVQTCFVCSNADNISALKLRVKLSRSVIAT